MFLEGKTPHTIAKHLTAEGIPSPSGKNRWLGGTVKSILTNEKYKGDALLQKTYTVDFLTKKIKANEGEVPQYYVENSHPAIIEPEVYNMVQAEMKRRSAAPSRYSGTGIFASRIVCGQCGSFYGSKVWHSTSKYRRKIYQCNNKFNRKEKCKTPHLDEKSIKSLFVTAVNKLLVDKNKILANFETVKQELFETATLDIEYAELQSELTIVAEMIQKCVNQNTNIAQNQDDYILQYEGLVSRFETAKSRFEEVNILRTETKARWDLLDAFIDSLKKQDGLISEFDEQLWYSLVDYATVYNEDDVRFTFKDGN